MKKINVILACLTIFGLMTGCGGFGNFGGGNTNTSERASNENPTGADAQEITMTLKAESKVRFSVGGNNAATIDWGDGSPVEEVTLNPTPDEFVHNYAQPAKYTIKITGENITVLECNHSDLTELNLNVSTLIKLSCYGRLTSLDVSKNRGLIYLACGGNQLTSLDVSKNTALKELYCYRNQLTHLDVSKNSELETLSCENNQLTSLDVSKNTKLQKLDCGDNQLTSLDISKNSDLTYLTCSGNQLTNLDVSKNTALTDLFCLDNQLTSLDVSKNDQLRNINFINNELSAEALNTLFHSLYDNDPQRRTATITISSNPGTDECDRSIAEKKGWIVEEYERG